MKIYNKASIMLLSAVLALSGCANEQPKDGEGADGAIGGTDLSKGPEIGKYGDGQGGAYSSGGGGYGNSSGVDNAGGLLSKNLVYFNYDSSEVLPEYVPVVEAHAAGVASNPGKIVVLEGHADARGSSEYNVALGEQRAKSVANMMKMQGVSERQIQVVSFGEEKPLVSGNDESAWSQNRRVEIAYPGQ
ncbi:peptidoglycan-associated lipoprotein Pal [Candidatus Methylospira mobilis]|uniref:Peptidoglycan-associated lipoprotein n=1 Tax=Candidatus Methylospira mobilis TaxID=1808979 RepID=A0A5Q0BIF2_9GAMM|nr:peptidoglycan-associated lipoprotein Pal [Candidatus Methylospira mobilis]QFY41606.1 peptidoglycan-associated lipoprotein Pal [Candidatus Methylospira mobilis]WNV05150.1 peptidoglycan-associated lipoprotein Pal [Candidatus Methylospira mobilis]